MELTTLSKPARKYGLPESLVNDAKAPWHPSAPSAVAEGYKTDEPAAWKRWGKYLAKRGRPRPLMKLVGRFSGTHPLSWAVCQGADVTARLIERIGGAGNTNTDSAIGEELECWLAETAGEPVTDAYGLECLAWCHALPRLAKHVAEATWWETLGMLVSTASDAQAIALDEQPLVAQLLAGELPITLAHLFPELTNCRKLGRPGRQFASSALVELLDGAGSVNQFNLPIQRPLLASWTRCHFLLVEDTGRGFKSSGEQQFEWLVRCALQWTRRDGSQILSTDEQQACEYNSDLFQAALSAGGDAEDRAIAKAVLPNWQRSRSNPTVEFDYDAAAHSEWAEVAMLRPGWSHEHPRLAIAYGRDAMRCEMSIGKETIFAGDWGFELKIDGQPIETLGTWEGVLWESDEDIDFLELEIQLAHDVRVQRQLLLAREDGFLYTADAVLGCSGELVEYRHTLPLAEGIRFDAAEQTREGFLVGRKRRALVMPLALPEWRTGPRLGQLEADTLGLRLSQVSEGKNLYCPLFFDLKPGRMKKARTWRQLTIAENREVLSRDAACGYRVQIDDEQWLFYRSLIARANRTLLGHNLTSEFLAGWFHPTGEVEGLMEVEE